jgi:hypothetical protein
MNVPIGDDDETFGPKRVGQQEDTQIRLCNGTCSCGTY